MTSAKLPAGVPACGFGPGVIALVSVLTGRYRLSKRLVQELLEDGLGIRASLGAICGMERTASVALAEPVEEAREFVREQGAANLDETGWREEKKRAWLWVAVTTLVTVFVIARSRGGAVARSILGEGFMGVLTTDRWSGYNWFNLKRRQLCWAHLIRDFTSWSEMNGRAHDIGDQLLVEAKLMFEYWNQFRDDPQSRKWLEVKMSSLKHRVRALLWEATECGVRRAKGMAKEILKLEPALWTFIREPDVEPTNNAAERAIRAGVIWRRGSFGTDSETGSRFAERILTTVTTLRQQHRHVLDYVTETVLCHFRGEPAPSLLPLRSGSLRIAA